MNKIDSLWGNIFKEKNEERQNILLLLKKIPLFSELDKGELKEIERLTHHRQYKAGEVIFWEDEPGVGMYIVQKGEVGIYKSYAAAQQRELARLQFGDFFGEMALLENDSRSATAVPLGETHLLGLFHPDLFDLFARRPQLGNKILANLANMLAQRLRRTNAELLEPEKNSSRPAGKKKGRFMSPQAENKSSAGNASRGPVFFLLKTTAVLLALLATLWILSYSGMVLTPLILASLLSILLNPLVVMLESRGFGRTAAVALVMAVISMALAVALVFLAPVISHEFKTLSSLLKNETPATLLEKLKALLLQHLPWLKNPGLTSEIMGRAEKFLYFLLNQSIRLLPSIIPVAIALVLIPFMTFFLLKDGRRLKKSFIQVLPNRYFEMAISLLHKIDGQLGSFIRGQILVSLCIGILAITALALLRVPYFFLIGSAAGLANMIPYFGPIVGAIPAVILNVIDKGSIRAALYVIAAFLIIRLIDDTLVSPNILGHSLKIHPLLVVIAIFTGGEMFGIMGLLLCIPVTGIVKVTIQELAWNIKHYRVFRNSD